MNGGAEPALQLPDERAGPKLTTAQRATLITVIATYWSTNTVQQVLAEEYADFPSVTDRTIRNYRSRLESGVIKAAEESKIRALNSGLALKGARVAHLARMHDQLAAVPLAERQGERWQLRLDVARERRELLNQIAREMGLEAKPTPGSPTPPEPGANLNGEGLEADIARTEAAELLGELQRRREAAAAAMAAAERAAIEAGQRRPERAPAAD